MDQVPPKNPSIQEKTLIEDNGVDLISNLPDDILCRILSKLPTKYAVGTSILSTRWKPLFSSIPYPCLDFDDTLILQGATGLDSYSDERINCFVNFVYSVMDVILKDVPFVYEFRLKCVHDYEDYQIMDWVNAALACHVMRLVLACNMDDPPCLFESLSGSASLTYLQLEGSIIDATASFSLPNLKHLVLEDAYCISEDSLLPLVSGCPELEDLTMRYTSHGDRDTLTISIPSLKYLIIEYCSNLEVPCTLELDTPKLELLFYTDNVAKGFTVKNLSSLQKAHIDFGNYEFLWEGNLSQYYQNVADLVTGCSSVDSLYMSKPTLTVSSVDYSLILVDLFILIICKLVCVYDRSFLKKMASLIIGMLFNSFFMLLAVYCLCFVT